MDYVIFLSAKNQKKYWKYTLVKNLNLLTA
jgi:hypothetical protein